MGLRSRRLAIRTSACLLWSLAVLAGLSRINHYANAAAGVSPQPDLWPQKANIALATDRPTLLLTLHPRCACSRATLEELTQLLAEAHTTPLVEILAFQPAQAGEAWLRSDLLTKARSLPGVRIYPDRGGLLSKHFGLSVSGQTALYAPDGRLLFSGGITASRGHAGDNAGRTSIVTILSRQMPVVRHTPVFGCSIYDRG